MVVTFRDAVADDYPAIRRLAATAFASEAFATGMFGESAVARFVGMSKQYATWPGAEHPVIVIGESEGVLLGVASTSLPAKCHICNDVPTALGSDATQAERVDHELLMVSRDAHLRNELPPHAHIATVATEQMLRGVGLGARLIAALVDRLWAMGGECAVLECLTVRESFYERCGFRRVVDFADPAGPGLRSSLMRIDSPGQRPL
jgi:GNAT superfamily N-acetyltransferase